jgi:hypothetical protein
METARFSLKPAQGDVTTASPFVFQQSDEARELLVGFIAARCREALTQGRSVRAPYCGVMVGAFILPKAHKAGWWVVQGERMRGPIVAVGLFHPWE